MRKPTRNRLDINALEARLACHRQTIWRWYTTRDFPRPHYLGQNRLWFTAEVEDWLQEEMLSRTSQKQFSREGLDKEVAEACTAESFYTMSGSSPPNVTSSKGGAK